MRRDEAARALWHEVYPELSEGWPGLLDDVTNRAEAQTLRLSMLYALLDGTVVIGRHHLEAALDLWRYCEASARYVFGDSLGDPVADAILAALRSARPDGLTRTELRDLFQRHQSAEAIDHALATLQAIGAAVRSEERTGGRPTQRWRCAR